MQLSLRAATDADLPFLLALRQESMGPHLARAGLHGTDEDFMARVMHRFDCAEIVLADGKPVGLLKLQREPGKWHLHQLQLAGDVRGQGLGRRILERILSEADSAGVPVTLFYMDMPQADARWIAAACPLYGFMAQTFHPDIDIDFERAQRKFCVPLSTVDESDFSASLS